MRKRSAVRRKTKCKIGCHGGKVEGGRAAASQLGRQGAVPSWQAAVAEAGLVLNKGRHNPLCRFLTSISQALC
jgi:hypothetical protein